jgi:hypothetical protein
VLETNRFPPTTPQYKKKLDLISSQDAATPTQRKDTGFWSERQEQQIDRRDILIE